MIPFTQHNRKFVAMLRMGRSNIRRRSFFLRSFDLPLLGLLSLLPPLLSLSYCHLYYQSITYRTIADLDVVLPTSLLPSRFPYPSTRLCPSCSIHPYSLVCIALDATSLACVVKRISQSISSSCPSTTSVSPSNCHHIGACYRSPFDTSTTRPKPP